MPKSHPSAPHHLPAHVHVSAGVREFISIAGAMLPLILIDIDWLNCFNTTDTCYTLVNRTSVHFALSEVHWQCLPALVGVCACAEW